MRGSGGTVQNTTCETLRPAYEALSGCDDCIESISEGYTAPSLIR